MKPVKIKMILTDLELVLEKLKLFKVSAFEIQAEDDFISFVFADESICFVSKRHASSERVLIFYDGQDCRNEDYLIEDRS